MLLMSNVPSLVLAIQRVDKDYTRMFNQRRHSVDFREQTEHVGSLKYH